MRKVLDWNAVEARAEGMTSAELHGARLDAGRTAELWDRAGPDSDSDGNSGYYRDEASVYAREQTRRRSAPAPAPIRCTRCGEADRSRGEHGYGRCVSF